MMNFTTDRGVKKLLSIAVLWCGKILAIQVDILDLIESPDGRAKTLFSVIESDLKKNHPFKELNRFLCGYLLGQVVIRQLTTRQN